MATIKLVCQKCEHAFTVSTRGAIRDKQKHCPECRSESVRQTLWSFLRNGPLSAPTCGAAPAGGG